MNIRITRSGDGYAVGRDGPDGHAGTVEAGVWGFHVALELPTDVNPR